jgi:hypothetical protein
MVSGLYVIGCRLSVPIPDLPTLASERGGSTQSRRRTMPTNWRRGSSLEASRGRLRFNHLTELGMAKIRQFVRRGECHRMSNCLSLGGVVHRSIRLKAGGVLQRCLRLADDVIE